MNPDPSSVLQHTSGNLNIKKKGSNGAYIINEAKEVTPPAKPQASKKYPQPVSAFDIAVQDIDPKVPFVEGLIPPGVTFLGGAPKSCKTIFAMQISQAVGNGQDLFNLLKTKKSEVLMLALEDDEFSLHSRVTAMSPIYPPSPAAHFMWQWGTGFSENMDFLDNYLKDNIHTGMVIVDTFEKFCGSGKKKSYSADYSVIGKIKELADANKIAILLVHHIIKNIPKNWVGAFYGTHGVAGAADGILFLDRIIGSPTANLHITGRNMADGKLNLKLNTEFLVWELTKNLPSFHLRPERREIFDHLLAAGEMKLKDIAKDVGKSVTAVQNLLDKMLKLNVVVRTATGVYSVSPLLKTPEPKSVETVEPMESTNSHDSTNSVEMVETVENTTVTLMNAAESVEAVDSVETTHQPIPDPIDL